MNGSNDGENGVLSNEQRIEHDAVFLRRVIGGALGTTVLPPRRIVVELERYAADLRASIAATEGDVPA